MSVTKIKVEPPDCDNTQCVFIPYDGALQESRKHSTERSQSDADVTQHRRAVFESSVGNYHQYQDAIDEYGFKPAGDVMPTLIPIRSSHGLTNGTNSVVQRKPVESNQRRANVQRSSSDTDAYYGISTQSDTFLAPNSPISVSEINRKLNIVLANQNRIMLQNDRLLSKLSASSSGGNLPRGMPVDELSHHNQRDSASQRRADLIEKTTERRENIGAETSPHTSFTVKVSNVHPQSSYPKRSPVGHCFEQDLGPSQRKSRRLSVPDGRSTASSGVTTPKSPSRDAAMAPPQLMDSPGQSSLSHMQVSSAGNILPLYANQCNMAVYVLRGGEESQLVSVLPVPYSQTKPGASKNNNSSLLSAQPALLYNAATGQYEASYVTGISHPGNVKASVDMNPLSREANTSNSWKATNGTFPNNINGGDSCTQPNITNVVSLRKESSETSISNVRQSLDGRRSEHTSDERFEPSTALQRQTPPVSSPASPILIEEDVKPTSLPSQEEMLHSQLRSFSMRNYAVQLMRALFRPHELMHRSVYENNERKGLDKKRLQQIKDYVFQIYPTPHKEKSLAWIECISAMNEAIRTIK